MLTRESRESRLESMSGTHPGFQKQTVDEVHYRYHRIRVP